MFHSWQRAAFQTGSGAPSGTDLQRGVTFYVSKADCKASYRGGEDVGQEHQSYVSVCYALRL